MPSLLITTSRRTSNRVRSFARDLWSALPGTDRFNRGGMGLPELISRIQTSGAQAALVISIWRGNPGELAILTPQGEEFLRLRLESALLRREIEPSYSGKVGAIKGVGVKAGSSNRVWQLARDLATLMSLDIEEYSSPSESQTQKNWSLIWFEDAPGERVLWTHFNTNDLCEIGPRIRVSSIKRLVKDESE